MPVNDRVPILYSVEGITDPSLRRSLDAASRNLSAFSRRSRRDLQRIEAQSRALNNNISRLFLGYFGFQGIRSLINISSEFSKSLAQVNAILDTNESQAKTLETTIRSLGRTTIFTSAQIADSATNMARAGLQYDEIRQILAPTLTLAQATATDLAASVRIMVSTLRTFGLEARESGRIIDVLVKAANSANTTLTEFGVALSYAAPTAAPLRKELEEIAAVLAVLADRGIQASRGGIAVRQVFFSASKALSDFGISVQDSDFIDVLKQIRELGFTYDQIVDKFETRSGFVINLLLPLVEELEDMEAALEAADGTAAKLAERMDRSVFAALKKVTSASSDFTQSLVRDSIGVTNTINTLESFARTINTISDNLNIILPALVSFTVLLQRTAAIKLGLFLSNFARIPVIIGRSARRGTALLRILGLFGRAIGGWPVLIGSAIAGVGAYALLAKNNIEELTDSIHRSNESLIDLNDNIKNTIAELAKENNVLDLRVGIENLLSDQLGNIDESSISRNIKRFVDVVNSELIKYERPDLPYGTSISINRGRRTIRPGSDITTNQLVPELDPQRQAIDIENLNKILRTALIPGEASEGEVRKAREDAIRLNNVLQSDLFRGFDEIKNAFLPIALDLEQRTKFDNEAQQSIDSFLSVVNESLFTLGTLTRGTRKQASAIDLDSLQTTLETALISTRGTPEESAEARLRLKELNDILAGDLFNEFDQLRVAFSSINSLTEEIKKNEVSVDGLTKAIEEINKGNIAGAREILGVVSGDPDLIPPNLFNRTADEIVSMVNNLRNIIRFFRDDSDLGQQLQQTPLSDKYQEQLQSLETIFGDRFEAIVAAINRELDTEAAKTLANTKIETPLERFERVRKEYDNLQDLIGSGLDFTVSQYNEIVDSFNKLLAENPQTIQNIRRFELEEAIRETNEAIQTLIFDATQESLNNVRQLNLKSLSAADLSKLPIDVTLAGLQSGAFDPRTFFGLGQADIEALGFNRAEIQQLFEEGFTNFEIPRFWEDVADAIYTADQAFSNFIADSITDIANLGEHLRQLGVTILRALSENLIARPITDSILGYISQFLPVGLNLRTGRTRFLGSLNTGGFDFSGSLFGGSTTFPQRGGALGTDVARGTTYRVNEFGQEFFTPGVSGRISPASELAGGGGDTYVFNITGDNPEAMKQQIYESLPTLEEALVARIADLRARGDQRL